MKNSDSSDGLDRMGRFMVYGAWILTAVLLTWVFTEILESQRNPNTHPETRTGSRHEKVVVLKRNRFGHYIASGRINGQPVEFLLDTGATHVSVPISVAERLGLRRGARAMAQTANGVITTFVTTLDSVELGEIELEKVRASINPHHSTRDVLLGMSFLKHLELIQRGDTLTIRQK